MPMIGSAASCASSAWLATVASFVVHMVGSTWSHAAPDPTGFVLAPHLSIFALRDDKTRLQLATMTMTQQTVGSRRGAWNGASVAYRSNRRHVSSTTTRQSVATPEPAPERSIQENELRLLTWMEVEARVKQEVAEAGVAAVIVPVGATEQHGPNGLIGTDHITAELCDNASLLEGGEGRKNFDTGLEGYGSDRDRSMEVAVARGVSQATDTILAPSMNYGMSAHHASFPGTVTLTPGTFVGMVRDVASSLMDSGFTHVLFINGHGGNVGPTYKAFAQIAAATGERENDQMVSPPPNAVSTPEAPAQITPSTSSPPRTPANTTGTGKVPENTAPKDIGPVPITPTSLPATPAIEKARPVAAESRAFTSEGSGVNAPSNADERPQGEQGFRSGEGGKAKVEREGRGGDDSVNKKTDSKAKARLKLISWYAGRESSALAKDLYNGELGQHATPDEVALTQHLFPGSMKEGVHLDPAAIKVAKELGGMTKRSKDEETGLSVMDKEDFRRRFPDGRMFSNPGLSTPEHGRRLLEAAVRDATEALRKFLSGQDLVEEAEALAKRAATAEAEAKAKAGAEAGAEAEVKAEAPSSTATSSTITTAGSTRLATDVPQRRRPRRIEGFDRRKTNGEKQPRTRHARDERTEGRANSDGGGGSGGIGGNVEGGFDVRGSQVQVGVGTMSTGEGVEGVRTVRGGDEANRDCGNSPVQPG